MADGTAQRILQFLREYRRIECSTCENVIGYINEDTGNCVGLAASCECLINFLANPTGIPPFTPAHHRIPGSRSVIQPMNSIDGSRFNNEMEMQLTQAMEEVHITETSVETTNEDTANEPGVSDNAGVPALNTEVDERDVEWMDFVDVENGDEDEDGDFRM